MTHFLSRRQPRRKGFLAKWYKVEWSKQDVELADELDRSRERIRQIRQELGAPQPAHPRRRRRTVAALKWAKDNLDKLRGLSGAELKRQYGLDAPWRKGSLYRLLKPVLRDGKLIRKHRWDLMDFSLPSSDLERIWRLPRNTAVMYRSRNHRRRPAWSFQGGHPQFSGRGQLQAYRRAVKAEERNAARYFARA